MTASTARLLGSALSLLTLVTLFASAPAASASQTIPPPVAVGPAQSPADTDLADYAALWRIDSFVDLGRECAPSDTAPGCLEVPTVTVAGPISSCLLVRDLRFTMSATSLEVGVAKGAECASTEGARPVAQLTVPISEQWAAYLALLLDGQPTEERPAPAAALTGGVLESAWSRIEVLEPSNFANGSLVVTPASSASVLGGKVAQWRPLPGDCAVTSAKVVPGRTAPGYAYVRVSFTGPCWVKQGRKYVPDVAGLSFPTASGMRFVSAIVGRPTAKSAVLNVPRRLLARAVFRTGVTITGAREAAKVTPAGADELLLPAFYAECDGVVCPYPGVTYELELPSCAPLSSAVLHGVDDELPLFAFQPGALCPSVTVHVTVPAVPAPGELAGPGHSASTRIQVVGPAPFAGPPIILRASASPRALAAIIGPRRLLAPGECSVTKARQLGTEQGGT